MKRHLDPLPAGYFYNGTQFVNFFGEGLGRKAAGYADPTCRLPKQMMLWRASLFTGTCHLELPIKTLFWSCDLGGKVEPTKQSPKVLHVIMCNGSFVDTSLSKECFSNQLVVQCCLILGYD